MVGLGGLGRGLRRARTHAWWALLRTARVRDGQKRRLRGPTVAWIVLDIRCSDGESPAAALAQLQAMSDTTHTPQPTTLQLSVAQLVAALLRLSLYVEMPDNWAWRRGTQLSRRADVRWTSEWCSEKWSNATAGWTDQHLAGCA